ncbi:MAG: hypothetical protein V3R51_05675 [Gammaproteobacteria bacterium]
MALATLVNRADWITLGIANNGSARMPGKTGEIAGVFWRALTNMSAI